MTFSRRNYNIEEWLALENEGLLEKICSIYDGAGRVIEQKKTRVNVIPLGAVDAKGGKSSSAACLSRKFIYDTAGGVRTTAPQIVEWDQACEDIAQGADPNYPPIDEGVSTNLQSLAGVQESATNYAFWEEVSVGDTLRIEIDESDQSPAFDQTFTVLVGEDRFSFATRVELELNQDFVNFQPHFRATRVDDNSIMFFEAKNIGEAGENLTVGSFRATGTGTITATLGVGFGNWERRTSTIQASKSSKDPRLGIFGVEGTVETRTADVSGLFAMQPYANDDPVQYFMNINAANTGPGNVGPTVFTFPMDMVDDIFVSEIRFFGLDSGIQFTKFLGRNNALSNGIRIEIKSDNSTITLPIIQTTEDFADKFAFGGGDNFQLYIQAGADKFSAVFLTSPFPLRRSGTFGVGNDDYIKITIDDNLAQITQIESAVVGVVREA